MNDNERRADTGSEINYHFLWPAALLIPGDINSQLYRRMEKNKIEFLRVCPAS